MASRGTQQQLSTERLTDLLSEVYSGRLLLPATGQPSWEPERRLRLVESIFRGLPIGGFTRWRTAERLDALRSLGPVPLQQPEAPASGEPRPPSTYLIDGLGRLTTLFEELGAHLWRADRSRRRRPLEAPAGARSSVVFEARTCSFHLRPPEGLLEPTEFPLSDLLEDERRQAFSTRVRALPEGERLAGALASLLEAVLDFQLPVITLVTEEVGSVRALLAAQRDSALAALLERNLRTVRWYCDTCGQPIEQPTGAVLEWLFSEASLDPLHLRLVHGRATSPRLAGCQSEDPSNPRATELVVIHTPFEDLQGPDGLARLIDWLGCELFSKAELIEVLRRLHVPGYERARLHLQDAIAQGIISPEQIEAGFYPQSEIAKVLDWADRQGRKP